MKCAVCKEEFNEYDEIYRMTIDEIVYVHDDCRYDYLYRLNMIAYVDFDNLPVE